MSNESSKPIDSTRWRDLVRDQTPALVLFAQQWCRSPEDVVQESLLKLFRQQPPPDRPVAWLYTVVRRQAINAGRAARRRQTHEHIAGEKKTAWFESPPSAAIEVERLQLALETLPNDLREIVVARVWGNLTLQEIADLTGLSVATAFRRYQSGLEALRTEMEPGTSKISDSRPSTEGRTEHDA